MNTLKTLYEHTLTAALAILDSVLTVIHRFFAAHPDTRLFIIVVCSLLVVGYVLKLVVGVRG